MCSLEVCTVFLLVQIHLFFEEKKKKFKHKTTSCSVRITEDEPCSPMVAAVSYQPFVDPYQDHDFSNDSREELLGIVDDLRERLASSEKKAQVAHIDRDRYAALVGKTNEGLLDLKVGHLFLGASRNPC